MIPKVSIVIPVFNREVFISLAVKSVLSQTFNNFELIILDDTSTDNTFNIIEKFLSDSRVLAVRHPKNIGITANRNYGLSVARGEYIAMLDSDDIWLDKHKLELQVNTLDTNPSIGIIGTFARRIDATGKITGNITNNISNDLIKKSMMYKNQFTQSSVLIRKKALDDVGWYNEKIPIWEDYELWLRIGEKYQFRNIPEFLTGYREHEGNISKESEGKSIKAYWMIYKLYRKKYPTAFIVLLKVIFKKILFYF